MFTIRIPVRGSARQAIVDSDDAALVAGKPWRLMVNKSGNEYAVYDVRRGNKTAKILMHRLIAGAPGRQLIDHKDRDGLNNTRSNLRKASPSQNAANSKQRAGVSRFKGVYWDRARGLLRARLMCDGRVYYMGRHKTEIAAAEAYNKKAKEVWGEFALLNQT